MITVIPFCQNMAVTVSEPCDVIRVTNYEVGSVNSEVVSTNSAVGSKNFEVRTTNSEVRSIIRNATPLTFT